MASTPNSEADEDESTKHGAIGHLSADEELQQAVCQALIEDPDLDSTAIGVRVVGEAVVLEGNVGTRQAWQRALSIAGAQRGVTEVRADALRISDSS
jgi:osmotically-inducible protein OsmY